MRNLTMISYEKALEIAKGIGPEVAKGKPMEKILR